MFLPQGIDYSFFRSVFPRSKSLHGSLVLADMRDGTVRICVAIQAQ